MQEMNFLTFGSEVIKAGEAGKMCSYCNKPRKYASFPPGGYLGEDYLYPLPCECLAEREVQELKSKNNQYRDKLFRISGMKQKHLEMTFETLTDKDPLQAHAIAICKQWPEDYYKQKALKGLLLTGGVGAGKTYLLCAIANCLIQNYRNDDEYDLNRRIGNPNPMPMFYFISTVDLFGALALQINTGNMLVKEQVIQTLEYCKKAPVLFLDDLGAEKTTGYKHEQLFSVFEARMNEKKHTIISTNATPDDLPDVVGDRTYDRLKATCQVVPISAKSHRKP